MTMRLLFFFIVVGIAFAQDQQTRPLSASESATLRKPIAVGERIFAALLRYPGVSDSTARASAGITLVTSMPTLEILRAGGYISGDDLALSRTYHAALQPVPTGAPANYPVLTMQTAGGELVFDCRGQVTLRDHR